MTVAQWVQRSSGEFLISVKSHSFSPGQRPVTGHDQTTGVTRFTLRPEPLAAALRHVRCPAGTVTAAPGDSDRLGRLCPYQPELPPPKIDGNARAQGAHVVPESCRNVQSVSFSQHHLVVFFCGQLRRRRRTEKQWTTRERARVGERERERARAKGTIAEQSRSLLLSLPLDLALALSLSRSLASALSRSLSLYIYTHTHTVPPKRARVARGADLSPPRSHHRSRRPPDVTCIMNSIYEFHTIQCLCKCYNMNFKSSRTQNRTRHELYNIDFTIFII